MERLTVWMKRCVCVCVCVCVWLCVFMRFTSHKEEEAGHILHEASVPAATEHANDPTKQNDGHRHAHKTCCHSPQICENTNGQRLIWTNDTESLDACRTVQQALWTPCQSNNVLTWVALPFSGSSHWKHPYWVWISSQVSLHTDINCLSWG